MQMRCSHSYMLNKNVLYLRLNMCSPTSDVRSSAVCLSLASKVTGRWLTSWPTWKLATRVIPNAAVRPMPSATLLTRSGCGDSTVVRCAANWWYRTYIVIATVCVYAHMYTQNVRATYTHCTHIYRPTRITGTVSVGSIIGPGIFVKTFPLHEYPCPSRMLDLPSQQNSESQEFAVACK